MPDNTVEAVASEPLPTPDRRLVDAVITNMQRLAANPAYSSKLVLLAGIAMAELGAAYELNIAADPSRREQLIDAAAGGMALATATLDPNI